ncbi:MAG TPA: malic enzyme-like NAD(P)-binding protein, partial [Candidatus Paceibacterota bacterium]|nr:malic enzyme-like NAD(P)-binding protein [Candidatus Paceibacterota bacterium]
MEKRTTGIVHAYKKAGARIGTRARVKLSTKQDFALFYTPGVGVASLHLARTPADARKMSVKRNAVAVISDGSAVLGLGDIGPYGALPVMEGKALIFRELADIDAWPLVLDLSAKGDAEARIEEIVRTVRAIAPAFGGINLEDIKAPECFEVERRLIEALDIPVMHDDQHGTAIVVLAGLMNAAKVAKKPLRRLKVVIAGAGAAGTAVAKLLVHAGLADVIVLDRKGIIAQKRGGLSGMKKELAKHTNPGNVKGDLRAALAGAD